MHGHLSSPLVLKDRVDRLDPVAVVSPPSSLTTVTIWGTADDWLVAGADGATAVPGAGNGLSLPPFVPWLRVRPDSTGVSK